MTLYEIADNYRNFFDAVEAGEIPEEAMADTLEAIDGDFEEKADNIACIIKEFLTLSSAQKAEAAELATRAKVNISKAENLRQYLLDCMQQTGKAKIETARNRIRICKKPPSLDVKPEFIAWAQEGHDELLTYDVPKPNKKAIKTAMEAGTDIPYVVEVQGERLDIR